MIGNYGICYEDAESLPNRGLRAYIVRFRFQYSKQFSL
jgi:hypothetical protein